MTGYYPVWQCGSFRYEQKQPLVMGILNITPDSFSDGGKYSNFDAALAHAHDMLSAGADIIDVGGESTRPGSKEVSVEQELARVVPLVKELAGGGACVSIDSRHPKVVSACLDAGAAIINDITGFTQTEMQQLAINSKAGCVVMHMQGRPQTMQANPHYDNVVREVGDFMLTQARLLTQGGVEHERICLDPGPGFGKNFEQNLELLRGTADLASLSVPPYMLMAAWSRKRFIGEITGETDPLKRVAASVAVALYAARQGAGVLRVHDVRSTVEALKVFEVIDG